MTKYRERGTLVDARQWYPPAPGKPQEENVVVRRFVGYDIETQERREVYTYRYKPVFSEYELHPGCWIVEDGLGNTLIYSESDFADLYFIDEESES